jgi:predicted phosphohydrolase
MLMKRIAWLTDIHLDFLSPQKVKAFCRNIVEHNPEAVLIGGDIGDARTIKVYLRILEDELCRPIYFVLGNHDYYRGSIAGVRTAIKEFCVRSDWLHWLPAAGVVKLTEETGLIGIDSWADGRLGNYQNSMVLLNDYSLIKELTGLDQKVRFIKLNELGDIAAAYLKNALPIALARFQHVLVLTHVPPFREACWHAGRISHDQWLPHFGCKAVGEALVDCMRNSACEITVLCGHTHSGGSAQILPTLNVKTGGAEYGKPTVQELLKIS